MKKGVFWYIGNHIIAYPDIDKTLDRVLYMQANYAFNHKLIWKKFHPAKGNKPYNYYPRGRVDIDNKNRPVIYANPHIDNTAVQQIIRIFELSSSKNRFQAYVM